MKRLFIANFAEKGFPGTLNRIEALAFSYDPDFQGKSRRKSYIANFMTNKGPVRSVTRGFEANHVVLVGPW